MLRKPALLACCGIALATVAAAAPTVKNASFEVDRFIVCLTAIELFRPEECLGSSSHFVLFAPESGFRGGREGDAGAGDALIEETKDSRPVAFKGGNAAPAVVGTKELLEEKKKFPW